MWCHHECGIFSSHKLHRILGLSLSRQMYTVLGPKFFPGVLANLVLTHEESMESRMEIFHAKHPPLSWSWVWLILQWHISQLTFPVSAGCSSFGWVWREHLICSEWSQQLNPCPKTVHYSQTLGSPFKQLPTPVNSKSRVKARVLTMISEAIQEMPLLRVSDLHSHFCPFPSSHTSLLTLLWIHFYFCFLLEGSAPRFLLGSLLCFFQVCTQISPS